MIDSNELTPTCDIISINNITIDYDYSFTDVQCDLTGKEDIE